MSGSPPGAIAGLMLRHGASWMAAGLAGAALGTLLVIRLLRGLILGVPAFDPIALGDAVATSMICGHSRCSSPSSAARPGRTR